MAMDIICLHEELLLDLNGLGQSFNFIDVSVGLNNTEVRGCEAVLTTALGDLLDDLESFAPGSVG